MSVPPSTLRNRNGKDGKENERQDPWSLRIARISGIPIRVHFTFLLVLIWFAVSDFGLGGANLVVAMLGLFFCVALHELGHSIVAQRYGYPVRDITLYPIGGVAAIEGSPSPRHELFIALAGPLVNVFIAAFLMIVLQLTGSLPREYSSTEAVLQALQQNPLGFLLEANLMLIAFNMIPAFPMDGGRVLRALLGLRLGKLRATRIAATIGQIIAVLMGLYGLGVFGPIRLFGIFQPSFGLVLIALFVYFAAGQERDMETTHEIVIDAPVRDAMIRDFRTLSVGDPLSRAAEALLETSQQDFPVLHGDEIMGVLSRRQLLRALAQEGPTGYVAGAMSRDVVIARPEEPLEEFMLRTDGVQHAPILVQDEVGNLVGMLTLENLMEFLTLRQILQTRDERQIT
ncbi:MAG: site-2 protease family protein [Capsulimonadales bacterium]|nr:site-2 protease family protein [Capsulimonadales bacterium]